MKTVITASMFALVTLIAAREVAASCRISNDTKWSFKIESGNVTNQSVGSHTTTSIASGKIKGIDAKAGKTISGSCKDGDTLRIIDDNGIPVLVLK